jgi:hypothetical protein
MQFEHIKQAPHCDAKILHAPGECQYCDDKPEWQELRQMWGIAFTGHSNETIPYPDRNGNTIEKSLIPCPSEWDRPVEIINKWGGNIARPHGK